MNAITARRRRTRHEPPTAPEVYARQVNEKIAAAVAEAPELPADLAARLAALIRGA